MRRPWVVVLLVFAVTRAVAAFATANPDLYPAGSADASFDIGNYAVWGNQMQDFGHWAYRDFSLEYPPGALPIANLPYWISDEHFRVAYILQSVAFDALGLAAVYRIAKRHRSWWGVAAWLVLLPLLGPVSYSRIDIVVAAAIAWALERADAGRWTAAGAWLGLGAAIKLTPILVLPAIAIVAPRRWRPVVAAGAVGAAFVVPFLRDLPELYDAVAGYHLERGVHAESLYGSLALLARVTVDADVELVGRFGATDILATSADAMKTLSNVAAIGVLIDSGLTAWKRVRRGDGAHVVLVVCGALTLLTAVGRVFSPQYLIWLVAPLAAGLAIAPRLLRWPALLLGAAMGLAHFVYPVVFYDYLDVTWWAVLLGVLRNVALLAAGLLAVRAAWQYSSQLPAVEEHEPVEAGLADVLVGPDR
jgi:hypothetical protein